MGSGNGHNVANGVISAIVLLCGVIFSVLVATLISQLVEGNSILQDEGLTVDVESHMAYATSPVWSLGFAFMIPGLIGCIAFCVKNKGVYITQMVFAIISLLVMGIVFIGAFFALGVLMSANPNLSTCHDDAKGKCNCGLVDSITSDSDTSNIFSGSSSSDSDLPYSCGDLKSMYGKCVGILLMIVFGWISTLAGTIVSGILACRQEYSPGAVIRAPMTTTVVHMAPVAGMAPQVGYMPPTYDQSGAGGYMPAQTNDHAKLVHNMEY